MPPPLHKPAAPIPPPEFEDAPSPTSTARTRPDIRVWLAGGAVVAVIIALVAIFVSGSGSDQPTPTTGATAPMHFCTTGTAVTVDISLDVGTAAPQARTNIPNDHCTGDESFPVGARLKVTIKNAGAQGIVGCTIWRNGHQVGADLAASPTGAATCSARSSSN